MQTIYTYMISSIPNTNNFHNVLWFQVFEFNSNKYMAWIVFNNGHLIIHIYMVLNN